MLHNIHSKTAQATGNEILAAWRPASPAIRVVRTDTPGERAKPFNEANTDIKVESTPELTTKLNELAKRRPFNILYRAKKYDPL